ncbi:hypothetical protein SteCoe_15335 [Stentor coeruleus]|uniref:Acid phosphatase n=1 Tax=Stentor coeruleus TaxID=5963 RepID=A0A1R2C3R0_9CILI|nr:hypothetical protein SteCoe_15335 [Stentor coeruleus]
MKFTFLILALLIHLYKGSVINVIEVCRHGARAPTSSFPWDTGYWKEGLGELTPEGQRQHFLLGAEIRTRYINEPVFINSYNSSRVYVQSTDVNRTIMSAESQLMGIYPQGPSIQSNMQQKAIPPLNISQSFINQTIEILGTAALPLYYQPVPVHVVGNNYDSLLLGYSPYVCPYFALISYWVEQSSDYQFRAENYTNHLQKQLYSIFNIQYTFDQAALICDTLITLKFHGYPWPSGITSEIFSSLYEIYVYFISFSFEYNGDALASSLFYQQIIQTFDDIISGTGTITFSLYSAHDITLVGFLSAIDAWDSLQPPFASSLIYELNEIGQDYFVRIVYNDKNITVGDCPVMCPYNQFKSLVNEWIIQDVMTACQLPTSFEKGNSIKALIS